MLSLMKQNILLNGLESKASAHVLDWGSTPTIPASVSEILQPSPTSLPIDITTPDSASASASWPQHQPPHQTRPDIILAADCVYFEPAFPLLLHTLQNLLQRPANLSSPPDLTSPANSIARATATTPPQPICYFCFKKRRKADWRFIKQLKKKFCVLEIDYGDKDQDRREGIYLYEVTAAAPS